MEIESVAYSDAERDAALARLRELFGREPDTDMLARARAFAAGHKHPE